MRKPVGAIASSYSCVSRRVAARIAATMQRLSERNECFTYRFSVMHARSIRAGSPHLVSIQNYGDGPTSDERKVRGYPHISIQQCLMTGSWFVRGGPAWLATAPRSDSVARSAKVLTVVVSTVTVVSKTRSKQDDQRSCSAQVV